MADTVSRHIFLVSHKHGVTVSAMFVRWRARSAWSDQTVSQKIPLSCPMSAELDDFGTVEGVVIESSTAAPRPAPGDSEKGKPSSARTPCSTPKERPGVCAAPWDEAVADTDKPFDPAACVKAVPPKRATNGQRRRPNGTPARKAPRIVQRSEESDAAEGSEGETLGSSDSEDESEDESGDSSSESDEDDKKATDKVAGKRKRSSFRRGFIASSSESDASSDSDDEESDDDGHVRKRVGVKKPVLGTPQGLDFTQRFVRGARLVTRVAGVCKPTPDEVLAFIEALLCITGNRLHDVFGASGIKVLSSLLGDEPSATSEPPSVDDAIAAAFGH